MNQQKNDLTTAARLLDIIFFIIVLYLIIGSIIYWSMRVEKPAKNLPITEQQIKNSGRAMQPIQRAVINNTRNRHATSSTSLKSGNRSSSSRDELILKVS